VVLPNNPFVLSSQLVRNFSLGRRVLSKSYRGKCNEVRARSVGWRVRAKRVEASV
jgi:hypothetical protein